MTAIRNRANGEVEHVSSSDDFHTYIGSVPPSTSSRQPNKFEPATRGKPGRMEAARSSWPTSTGDNYAGSGRQAAARSTGAIGSKAAVDLTPHHPRTPTGSDWQSSKSGHNVRSKAYTPTSRVGRTGRDDRSSSRAAIKGRSKRHPRTNPEDDE